MVLIGWWLQSRLFCLEQPLVFRILPDTWKLVRFLLMICFRYRNLLLLKTNNMFQMAGNKIYNIHARTRRKEKKEESLNQTEWWGAQLRPWVFVQDGYTGNFTVLKYERSSECRSHGGWNLVLLEQDYGRSRDESCWLFERNFGYWEFHRDQVLYLACQQTQSTCCLLGNALPLQRGPPLGCGVQHQAELVVRQDSAR